MAVPTLADRISESFAAWEIRGRGWQLVDYPVWLEPPYRPFFLLPTGEPERRHIDDGRRPTLLSTLAEKVWVALALAPPPDHRLDALPYEEQPPFKAIAPGEPIARLLLVEPDHASSAEVAGLVVRILSSGRHPASFEIIGRGGKVAIQIACEESDAEQAFAMIADYLPDVALVDAGDNLMRAWVGDSPLVCDYGLNSEPCLPILAISSFRIDPYIALISALARVRDDETLCFQVLFQRTYNPWRTAILEAVTASDGKSLFVDAPEFPKRAQEKTASPVLAAVVRLAAASENPERSLELIRSAHPFLGQFDRPGSNSLIPLSNAGYDDEMHESALLARMSMRTGMLLSVDELVGLIHVPDRSVANPALVRIERRTKAAPGSARGNPFVLGDNLHRGECVPVTLSVSDRLAHTLVVGATGTGKSTLLVNLIRQDMEQGYGCAVLDPHGDLIDDVLKYVPDHRRSDVVIFDPADEAYPVGFNILAAGSEREKILLASDLSSIFQRLATSWGDTMTTVLGNAAIAMLEHPEGGTLLHMRRFLVDDPYRKQFLSAVRDTEVRFFWDKEWLHIGSRSIGPLLSRLNAFLRPKLIRNIVGQRRPKLHFTSLMDDKKILLCKLSQGLIGNENAYLLGSLLLSRILQCALARQATAKANRTPFFLHVDEAAHFLTPSVTALLNESRKYAVGLTLSLQSLAPLRATPTLHSAALGNCQTRIVFRVGDDDTRTLAEGFSYFEPNDLKRLTRGDAIVRIGEATNDCNVHTHPLPDIDDQAREKRIASLIERSRQVYAADKAEVEQTLADMRPEAEAVPTVEKPQPTATATPIPDPLVPQSVTSAPKKEVPRLAPKRAPPVEPTMPGRGGPEHKYLQQVIRRLAEERKFRAVIEEPIPDGQVDVALHRDGLSIACQVCITTTVEHELTNARKCLAAKFEQVWLVTADTKKRDRLAKASKELGTLVRALAAEELAEAFEALAAPETAERIVGGYKVKAKRRVTSYEEHQKQKATIAEVIAKSLLKQKKEE